jgi:hypothetical protein
MTTPTPEATDYRKKDWLPYFDPVLVLPDRCVCPPTRDTFNVDAWLAINGGTLYKYKDQATGETAAQSIERAADSAGVSRRLLLVTLQREQSLVKTKATLTQYKMDRACGQAVFDSRPTDSLAVQARRAEITARNKGFRNQLFGAAVTYAKRFKEWIPGTPIKVNYSNGEDPMTVSDDSWEVRVPNNAATWALLRYTPHDVASRVTRDIWRGFFGTGVV